MFGTILLVFALVFAACATFGIGAPRFTLGWASLACYYLSLLLGSFGGRS